ncbi:hypothetical protein K0M31_001828 [Melipona bicolor]|uniref:Secreted protein n=1 Tax=Melipona bicolor TaxID=60889 RepID=A0AA40KY95_9HYME|nr:hypothetical protein K0M31_001828 [Melipona bicolor]
MRMFLWDSFVLGVLLYGVGIQGEERNGTTTAKVHQMDTWIGYENTGLYSAGRNEEGKNKGKSRTEGVEF